ncbi:MAG: glycoside hydrolase, partial [Phototrophicales bacterium]
MLKKQSVEKGKFIKVTFYTHAIKEASSAFLVGDFNDWNETSHPMEKLKDGR